MSTSAIIDREAGGERNAELADILRRGKLPLLPFELETLRERMQGYINDQQRLGRLLGEAMDQSSETFHDNAPADAIEDEANILVAQVRRVQEAIRNAVELPYPDAAYNKVTLGTLVDVAYSNGDSELIYLTGHAREIDAARLGLPEDTMIVTLVSPVGESLLGMKADGQTEYVVAGRKHMIELRTIFQHRP